MILAATTASGAAVDTFSKRDARVLTAALADFDANAESREFNPPGIIAVVSETQPLPSHLATARDINGLPDLHPSAPPDSVADYLRRNRVGVLLRLDPHAPPSLQLERPKGTRCAPSISRSPGVRTCVYPQAPGYSASGDWAFVTFQYLWSIHSGVAVYLLRRETGNWAVAAKFYQVYL